MIFSRKSIPPVTSNHCFLCMKFCLPNQGILLLAISKGPKKILTFFYKLKSSFHKHLKGSSENDALVNFPEHDKIIITVYKILLGLAHISSWICTYATQLAYTHTHMHVLTAVWSYVTFILYPWRPICPLPQGQEKISQHLFHCSSASLFLHLSMRPSASESVLHVAVCQKPFSSTDN